MNALYIDATKREEIFVELEINGKKHKDFLKDSRSENIVSLIDKSLKENKIEPKDLNEIRVNVGPGSFTGIRIGISIANALGFALGIPVNGKIGGELNPVYNK